MTKKRSRRSGAHSGQTRRQSPSAKRRALDAVAAMRHGKSLSRAARLAHTTPRTVRRYAGEAIHKERSGSYAPRVRDSITRPMRFLAPDGVTALDVRSSAVASRIGAYWNAVDRYLRTGKRDALAPFRGKRIRAGNRLHEFITDPRTLDRLANAGEVRFEDLYALTA